MKKYSSVFTISKYEKLLDEKLSGFKCELKEWAKSKNEKLLDEKLSGFECRIKRMGKIEE
jgi:hypothetical protein